MQPKCSDRKTQQATKQKEFVMELNWEKIDKVLARAFDYDAVFKKINRSEAEVNQLRKLVDEDKSIPPCVTNKHVSFANHAEGCR